MIQDSGDRTTYETGAKRDLKSGKGRCDLMPLNVIAEITNDDFFCRIHTFQKNNDISSIYYAIDTVIKLFFNENYPDALLELSKHFEEGATKYGERNWEKGIPYSSYIDSATRHYLKACRGDNDEPHHRACLWNLVCLASTYDTNERIQNTNGTEAVSK